MRAFPVTDVQAFMGHQSITTTMRYVHHVPRHDAAAKLSAAFAVDLMPEIDTTHALSEAKSREAFMGSPAA